MEAGWWESRCQAGSQAGFFLLETGGGFHPKEDHLLVSLGTVVGRLWVSLESALEEIRFQEKAAFWGKGRLRRRSEKERRAGWWGGGEGGLSCRLTQECQQVPLH